MGEAEAGVIYGTLSPSNGKVGFSSGYTSTVTGRTAGPSSNTVFSFNRRSSGSFSSGRHSVKFNGGFGAAQFKTAGGLLALFSANPLNKFAGVGVGAGTVAWRTWRTIYHPGISGHKITGPDGSTYYTGTVSPYATHSHSAQPSPFADKFALFKFNVGAGTEYGWLKLSLDNNRNTSGSNNSYGPDVTLVQWAYDTSGAQIYAGETPGGVPEPGTFAMTGLAALALGAVGVRRWRAARAARTA